MSTTHGDVVTLDIAVRPNDLRLYLKGDGHAIADWSVDPDTAELLARRLVDAAKQAREQREALRDVTRWGAENQPES